MRWHGYECICTTGGSNKFWRCYYSPDHSDFWVAQWGRIGTSGVFKIYAADRDGALVKWDEERAKGYQQARVGNFEADPTSITRPYLLAHAFEDAHPEALRTKAVDVQRATMLADLAKIEARWRN